MQCIMEIMLQGHYGSGQCCRIVWVMMVRTGDGVGGVWCVLSLSARAPLACETAIPPCHCCTARCACVWRCVSRRLRRILLRLTCLYSTRLDHTAFALALSTLSPSFCVCTCVCVSPTRDLTSAEYTRLSWDSTGARAPTVLCGADTATRCDVVSVR